MIDLSSDAFPSSEGLKTVEWAPILLQPILESPERLVIAVAAFSSEEFKIVTANSLERLGCLFGDEEAEWLKHVILDSVEDLEQDFKQRTALALRKPDLLFHGISLGPISKTEGFSAEQVAMSFLAALSSLHSKSFLSEQIDDLAGSAIGVTGGPDRLPWLVHEFVQQSNPKLALFFSRNIVARKVRRIRSEAHKVLIDYSGHKIVANFGTLRSSNFTNSVDVIKRRLWDLKVNRDTHTGFLASLNHELYVQHQAYDDPQLTQKQVTILRDAVVGLEEQADTENVRFRPFSSVKELGNKLIELETAA